MNCKSIIKKLTNKMIYEKVIDIENKEIYEFGLLQTYTFIVNMITTVFIALIFHMEIECFIFTFAYISIRSFAGGFHCKNKMNCYLFSNILTCIALYVIKIIKLTPLSIIVIFFSCGLWLVLISPIDNPVRKLLKEEKKIYASRTKKIIIMHFLIITLLLFYDKYKGIYSILVADIAALCMAVFGLIYNKSKEITYDSENYN